MQLRSLKSSRYRSLRDASIRLGDMTVLIGVNAAGKSNVLDALRFLAEGAREKTSGNLSEREGECSIGRGKVSVRRQSSSTRFSKTVTGGLNGKSLSTQAPMTSKISKYASVSKNNMQIGPPLFS
jgi:predicted ATPase